MGYEIAGGMGAKMADPSREVYVLVGDGSYLMMHGEIATMAQEGIKVIIVVLDNHGFASIGGLSESTGSQGFGTEFRRRASSDQLDGTRLAIDYVANAASLGARAMSASSRDDLADAIGDAQQHEGGPVCIVVETDRSARVPGYESWWDVPVAEVAETQSVRQSRQEYELAKRSQRYYL
jgi:3D-(3,5/4)-trihydroxycyclohexane-1,2-dione acylhydrolase (decyclizing)